MRGKDAGEYSTRQTSWAPSPILPAPASSPPSPYALAASYTALLPISPCLIDPARLSG